MRFLFLLVPMMVATLAAAGTLPVILTQPQDLTNSGTFSVVSPNALGFQWRCNGADIPGATNATLARTVLDPAGYYAVVAENDTGWVPSRLAYLSRGSGGLVPLSNYGNASFDAQACYQLGTGQQQGGPLTSGFAQVVAGPEIDEMQPAGDAWDFSWYSYDPSWAGYFDDYDRLVPGVSPGQTVYYQVNLSYPLNGGTYTQPSRTLALVAGGGSFPTPSAADLKFPLWPEWPEPVWYSSPSTNIVVVPGETLILTNWYFAYTDFGNPTFQWRKDGEALAGATNVVLYGGWWGGSYLTTFGLTNIHASDAGIYDVVVRGNRFICQPKITLSVQLSGGSGLLQSPRINGANFLCELAGAIGRQYEIQGSSDLISWIALQTVTNVTGAVTFSCAISTDAPRFYRSRLLPP